LVGCDTKARTACRRSQKVGVCERVHHERDEGISRARGRRKDGEGEGRTDEVTFSHAGSTNSASISLGICARPSTYSVSHCTCEGGEGRRRARRRTHPWPRPRPTEQRHGLVKVLLVALALLPRDAVRELLALGRARRDLAAALRGRTSSSISGYRLERGRGERQRRAEGRAGLTASFHSSRALMRMMTAGTCECCAESMAA